MEFVLDGFVRQSHTSKYFRNFIGKHGSHGSVGVADFEASLDTAYLLQGRVGFLNQFPVKYFLEPEVLVYLLMNSHMIWCDNFMEYGTQVQFIPFPMV